MITLLACLPALRALYGRRSPSYRDGPVGPARVGPKALEPRHCLKELHGYAGRLLSQLEGWKVDGLSG